MSASSSSLSLSTLEATSSSISTATTVKKVSTTNIKILTEHEKAITEWLLEKLTPIEPQKKSSSIVGSTIDYVYSWLPTKETAGMVLGKQVGETYGSTLSNKVVATVATRYFSNQQTWMNWIRGVSVTSALQLTLTPYLTPLVSTLSVTVGGFIIPTIVVLTQTVYAKYLSSDEKQQQIQNKTIKDLYKYDEKTKKWSDAFGNPIDVQSIQTTCDYLVELDIIRLLKEIDVSQVKDFFTAQLVKTTMKIGDKSKEVCVFQDGLVLDDKMMDIFRNAMKSLTTDKPRDETDAQNIRKWIHEVAVHTKKPIDEEDWESEVLTCNIEEPSDDIEPKKTQVGHCLRSTGEVVDEERIEKIKAECEQKAKDREATYAFDGKDEAIEQQEAEQDLKKLQEVKRLRELKNARMFTFAWFKSFWCSIKEPHFINVTMQETGKDVNPIKVILERNP